MIVPDVRVVETASKAPHLPDSGGTATLTTTEPIVTVTLLNEEIHESRLTILDAATRSAVTVIEVLSPTNKHLGERTCQLHGEAAGNHLLADAPCRDRSFADRQTHVSASSTSAASLRRPCLGA